MSEEAPRTEIKRLDIDSQTMESFLSEFSNVSPLDLQQAGTLLELERKATAKTLDESSQNSLSGLLENTVVCMNALQKVFLELIELKGETEPGMIKDKLSDIISSVQFPDKLARAAYAAKYMKHGKMEDNEKKAYEFVVRMGEMFKVNIY